MNDSNQVGQPVNPYYLKANISIVEAAKALRMDPQTVRLMIQNGIVPWGKCWKRPGSKRYSYLVSPKLFYEQTGVRLGDGTDEHN